MLTRNILALVATTALAAPHTPISARAATNSSYSLTTSYKGSSFFDNFSFYTGADPTNGFVNYTSRLTAANTGLVGFIHNLTSNASTAYIGVDYNTTTSVARNSVRLIGDKKFNAGSMAVIDVRHIPVQNGVWPAIWMLGADGIWPSSGESDILEYVHTAEGNAVTLHTAPGFVVDNSTDAFQGSLVDSNCNAVDATKGCSITMEHDTSNSSLATAGEAFNAQRGGVYVHDWTNDGITVWLFPRDQLPADLVAGHPDSATWTRKPLAKFTGKGDFGTTFKNMQLILNIDFCGDWAGKEEVWNNGPAKLTGAKTCAEYVGANPLAFKESYFEIGSIDFYSAGAPSYDAPSKRSLSEHDHDVKSHHHHGHHNHAVPTDSASQVQPSSTVDAPVKRSATTSDASATEVAGWLVAADNTTIRTDSMSWLKEWNQALWM
ncbi:uncharacterized protein RCC_01204 [Ramularia collo-cygni]|uniref:GH16 domain-containing protein n=1 Tax=Ramularia collo-cygni TaxID=112498 RepID=A0A2D3UMI0_9PEZI|nr:uncharacterized protein RCC_01204 [Ramularia collo-cygni]CZT15341.1 uncharacterized protein RCC_01204 [Ramularia collo-cygni]